MSIATSPATDVRRMAWLLLLGACASPSPPARPLAPGSISDAGAPDDPAGDLAIGSHDLGSTAHADLATAHDLATAPDLSFVPSPAGGCVPRINELATGLGGAASDEFVELYNGCAGAVDLSGWKLVYRAGNNVSTAHGVDSTTLYSFAAKTMAAGAYLVFGGSGFGGAMDGALGGGLKDGAGAVGLRDGTGALVDSLGYGTVDPSSAFIRGSAAGAPTSTSSLGRTPDGSDSGDNNADFKLLSPPSPGAANP